MYKEADEEAQQGPTCKLQNRLLFHLSHKFNDEKRLMGYHHNLQDVVEDQVINHFNLAMPRFYSLSTKSLSRSYRRLQAYSCRS